MSAKSIKICFCIFLASLVAVGIICVAGLTARCITTKTVEIETISNPDQGFYRPVFTKVTDTEVKPNGNINSAARLLHLRMDISAFSTAAGGTDKPLTEKALAGIDDLLAGLRKREKNAVIRFAYAPQFGDMKNAEPSDAVMKTHIQQICSVLDKYESVITAVEVGMIGPWGEMHSSSIANAEHISPLIDEYLTKTRNIAILVRTPKMIYNYLGISDAQIADYKIPPEHKAYRLGLFNDGYLGSANDLGTYTNRERDVAFLGAQNEHLPYGGEVTIPDSKLHNIENCLPEMNALGLSYLNVEWNNQVIDKWKKTKYTKKCGNEKDFYGQTAFKYIENHMGYRFVLGKTKLKNEGGALTGELKINNVGFGNMFKKKSAKIILTNTEGETVFSKNIGEYSGESALNFSAEHSLPAGKYGVYLCLYGDELDGNPLYTVQFANKQIWSAELKANKLGSVTVK